MPTYEYACRDCGEHLEVVQRFDEDALTDCPACQGRLRKVFSPIGITFKGSGFYKNDSRSSSSSSSSGKDSSKDTAKESSSDSAKETSSTSSKGSSSSESSTSAAKTA